MIQPSEEEKMTSERSAKKGKKIVCIDSDGTALDTMNIKHIRCFGPCFVKEWGLDRYQFIRKDARKKQVYYAVSPFA